MNDIAIVGLSFRLPGANTLDEFSDLLKGDQKAISEVQNSRWNWKDYIEQYGEEMAEACRFGGFIDNPDDKRLLIDWIEYERLN